MVTLSRKALWGVDLGAPSVLTVPGASQAHHQFSQCHPSGAISALRLELWEEPPGAPIWCSLLRELVALPCESLSTLRSPRQRIWCWESCQSSAASPVPWGACEVILLLSVWKGNCDHRGGVWAESRETLTLFSTYISKMYPRTTGDSLIPLGWQKPASVFL